MNLREELKKISTHIVSTVPDITSPYFIFEGCPDPDTDEWSEYADTIARRTAERLAYEVEDSPGWSGRCDIDTLTDEIHAAWLDAQAHLAKTGEPLTIDLHSFL